MNKPNIQTTKQVVPMLYGYSTPEVVRHNGWTKIGYTEQDVETRINQQTHTADIRWQLEWKGNATFDDGSGETFIDKDFHAYLRKSGIEQEKGKNNEWFHVDGATSKQMFRDFREDHGILKTTDAVIPYKLREEQQRAVTMTVDYQATHKDGEFLWNAKPRFGKTLSVYDFVQKTGAEKVLIVTNRPAIANSWFSDYAKFLGSESGYLFVSEVDALKGKRGVLTREEYTHLLLGKDSENVKCIEFVSLQDMKGSIYFGGQYDKLGEVANMEWDILVIDEAHEGVDTYKTDVAFDRIKRKFTLHLSGTPFKALANNKFADDAIYNWTYADEQKKKRDWDVSAEEENPYSTLPQLNLYTYQMSEIIKDELQQGIEIDGETEEYAFDLNEFFAVTNGKFNHESSVDKFLDALTRQTKFPFSTEELRDELKHTFWLLDRVDSAKALAKKLREHPIFQEYEVVLAAGDGKLDDDEETMKSYDKVVAAIAQHEKTITLSVGQLTTGITIPEWTAVLMLSNMRSPALYMQAAFRAQNPCLFKVGTSFKRKENAYVFDFDPARTLTIFEQFANNLNPNTAKGGGTAEERKENVKELLNFFPVIGEDEQGELVELDAEKVLTIPRKIRSVEVVKRGFMSNFLFQNISNIFGAPKEVIDIITKFEPIEEPKSKVNLTEEEQKDLSLDENGEVALSDEFVIGRTKDVFGDKIYDVTSQVQETMTQMEQAPDKVQKAIDKLKEAVKQSAVKAVVDTAQSTYGSDMKAADKRQIATFDTIIPDKVFLEVTSITLDQFKFLRDGGDYVEEETGQTKHFDGQLFDSVVFDDSVKEFLALKKKLADYFDEKSVEDIFDYIPPQKTNQIFTPKTMVKKMVDMLEQENPGCFDMPDKTFIDLYMKSGLYITEIVKRLYQSDEMKKQFPDNKERLKHIFEKQVYGLAPTEIIYKIATSYILGFDADTKDIKHNFRQLDALPYAKEGTLEQMLDELYSEDE